MVHCPDRHFTFVYPRTSLNMHAIRWHGILSASVSARFLRVEVSCMVLAKYVGFICRLPPASRFSGFAVGWWQFPIRSACAYGVDDFIDRHCLAFAVHYLADDTVASVPGLLCWPYGGMRHNGNNDALQVRTLSPRSLLCQLATAWGTAGRHGVILLRRMFLRSSGRFLQLGHHFI